MHISSKNLALLLILSFSFVALFGVLGMGFMGHDSDQICPIGILLGGNCMSNSLGLAMVNHYISGFEHATQSIFTGSIVILLLALALFATSVLLKVFARKRLTEIFIYLKAVTQNIDSSIISYKKLLRWLVLRNKRDYLNTYMGA